MSGSGRPSKSRVYVEVTIPGQDEPVSFYTEAQVTDELDVRALHKILEKSEEEIGKALGLRHKMM